MGFSDRRGLFHKQRREEVVSNSGKFVIVHTGKIKMEEKSKEITSFSGPTLTLKLLQCSTTVKQMVESR